ncbi:ParA family protein [Syntrophomonas wolfei]|uniref:AAA domain-containing protein n=1 Tax=Syntrophomonas wolfei subsp. wolfei (strain DSM 2245B / Goettingen) TaxID=335541 RepID=Q0AWP8_SYNWW|nr:AAA family ATPase [Syntrophomonas wolfei]ABI68856.1 hypothetical protein Swol_1553 [Syntrophomonas wolfei subsp. wolfei str. Goettingen G311]
MIKVIMIISNRPACGQTTVAVNLASGLSRKGYRVLIGDTGNNKKLCHWLGIDRQEAGTKAAKPLEDIAQAKIFSSRLGIDLLEVLLNPGGFAAANYSPHLEKLAYDYLLLAPASSEECNCLSAMADALIVCSDLTAANELEELKNLEELWRASRINAGGINLILPNKINTKEWEHNIEQLSILADYFGYEHIADPIPT